MNQTRMAGKGAGGRTCKYGCCSEKPNHTRKDRKANKRRARRVAKLEVRG